ncbi:MAG: F0F1 ATP synthase subunit B [Lachnospiraceae bacterium]|nr:F0F1 ATP synthase subunit B [Lachnospiraceae bacterium]
MERLFDLDFQLLHDAAWSALAVFILFLAMSYLLFNPVRELLEKRQARIKEDLDSAARDKEEAASIKSEYEGKLKEVEKESEAILAEARKKAQLNESRIVADAKEEAQRIVRHAEEEAELSKQKAYDEMKNEMIQIASLMAGKVVKASIDTEIQDSLVEETLKEVGESTWQS